MSFFRPDRIKSNNKDVREPVPSLKGIQPSVSTSESHLVCKRLHRVAITSFVLKSAGLELKIKRRLWKLDGSGSD